MLSTNKPTSLKKEKKLKIKEKYKQAKKAAEMKVEKSDLQNSSYQTNNQSLSHFVKVKKIKPQTKYSKVKENIEKHLAAIEDQNSTKLSKEEILKLKVVNKKLLAKIQDIGFKVTKLNEKIESQISYFSSEYESLKAYKDDKIKTICEKHLQTLGELKVKFEKAFTELHDLEHKNKVSQATLTAILLFSFAMVALLFMLILST